MKNVSKFDYRLMCFWQRRTGQIKWCWQQESPRWRDCPADAKTSYRMLRTNTALVISLNNQQAQTEERACPLVVDKKQKVFCIWGKFQGGPSTHSWVFSNIKIIQIARAVVLICSCFGIWRSTTEIGALLLPTSYLIFFFQSLFGKYAAKTLPKISKLDKLLLSMACKNIDYLPKYNLYLNSCLNLFSI